MRILIDTTDSYSGQFTSASSLPSAPFCVGWPTLPDPASTAPAEATVLLPVVCPECGNISETEFPICVVMIGLAEWHQMALYANCHETVWNASPLELYNTRTLLGEAWMKRHWGTRSTLYSPRYTDEKGNAPDLTTGDA